MPIQITLSDSQTLEVDVTLEDWNAAYAKALRDGTLVEIEEPDGRVVSVNPDRVVLLESPPPAA
jgi:hypothetical protein